MSIARAQARFARVPFATFLGVTLVDVTHARAVLALPFQSAHANAAGPLNGGASASLLLMAGTVAAWTNIDFDSEPHLSSVDMSIHYLSPAREEDILAEAQVVQRGRDLIFFSRRDFAHDHREAHLPGRHDLSCSQLCWPGPATPRPATPRPASPPARPSPPDTARQPARHPWLRAQARYDPATPEPRRRAPAHALYRPAR